MPHRRACAVLVLLLLASVSRAADPTDNPIATFYSGGEGYPAWTDSVNWSRVINMQTYKKGKNDYQKFERARDELSEGGGVMYYPAGTYDFTSKPPGRGLFLRRGVVVRGEAPTGHPLASEGKLDLPTKFLFSFRERGGGKVPGDWNFISLMKEEESARKYFKDVDQTGIAWVHLVGASVYFGPQFDWKKTWGSAGGSFSDMVKTPWAPREPGGSHPGDVLAGGGTNYEGAGKSRFVFGCVLEDSAVLDDFLDPGYGPNGFHTQRYCARLAVYGSRVLVANNLLPRSKKNFKYTQKTKPHPSNRGGGRVLFDYGKTCGIDVNKELLVVASDKAACKGYFEEGVVVRDNFVFNHGQKGYSVAGNWVTVSGNRNERAFLRQGDDIYGLGPIWALTADGYQMSGPDTDNSSRAIELAGRNVWADGNTFNNTGSSPGKDGEGIVCQTIIGARVLSWALTHNTHTRGVGAAGLMGALDADCHGLLVGWNQTAGSVGNVAKRKETVLADCVFVANKGASVAPDARTVARLGLKAPLTAAPAEAPAPTKVQAEVYQDDAVKITWTPAAEKSAGFRVERKIGEGKWTVIAYRPPHLEGDSENPAAWVDFTAPSGKPLTYRVVAVNASDDEKGASAATTPVTLAGGAGR